MLEKQLILLVIAQEAEVAQHTLEQQAKTASLGAALGFALGHASATQFFTQEAHDAFQKANIAKSVKLEALSREREIRWGGV